MTILDKNYIHVLKHRVKKAELPNFNHLYKLKNHIPDEEIKVYVEKAKAKYDTLTNSCCNDTISSDNNSNTKNIKKVS